MTIQWFPGHMLETKNLLKSAISKVDVVMEILDARLPDASANPLVDKICKDKFRLKVLNKQDLADPDRTKEWLEYFETRTNTPAICICGTQKSQADEALDYCIKKIDRNRARKIKVMVIGIPNTGKSTILNSLAGKKIAKTGNVPAITRHQQRTSLKDNIDIYDTPGILWPVIEPKEKAYILAASGAISDTAIDYEDIAFFAAGLLIKHYPDLLVQRYPFLNPFPKKNRAELKPDGFESDKLGSNELKLDELGLIEKLGAARGCLKKGGIVDLQKASEALIRELRAGKIGKISFETPKDIEHDN